ncbi:MAG: CPBP family intramembrane metalloprotease [Planctomycetes bacterium]|nr:CPBP family intramembrane metalloprotease [Planctomycetota bacterium]
MQAFLRWSSVLAAFLAVWALLEQATRWLDGEVPSLSPRTLFLLLAGVALLVLEAISAGGGRTPWKPGGELLRGAHPWLALLGFAAIVWAERALFRGILDGPDFHLPEGFERFFVAVLLTPLVAEVAFRGVLWRVFEAASGGTATAFAAILGSTVCYALFTVPLFASSSFPSLELKSLETPALFGLGLGLLRQGTQGILPGLIISALLALLKLTTS